ncbi:cellulose synthase catalytic subunit [uncultured Pseudokineococcus sp.]|uniref:glycosyltransferase family 2 protein n=1 Tax=uncultured Pseudokineococcus sp. TaxID=1642928 RepID=UPI002611C726|nr:cellulose synthase catalytic subunit [uncultured Pseudokineococcus sp.]
MTDADEAPPGLAAGAIDYEPYTRLAGPLTEPPEGDYVVEHVNLIARDRRRVGAYVMLAAALVFEVVFLVWLLNPSHLPTRTGDWTWYLSMGLVASIGLIETMRLVNVATLVRATVSSADPVPVRPEAGHRVAFITTIVPGKEPVEMAEKTLAAARDVRYDGVLDVWLLDEGDDDEVRAMCARLGVHHFSRKGVDEWNQPSGRNKRKTKHGNYNAWLDAHGDDYDFWVSVDTDHVPRPELVERLLGYFRDPDVAFVVAPQVYGNDDDFITRAAESQQYLFHSVLQRAGNRWGCPMFVGTNNAVRISALRDIDGLADSITEDAATSLVWHTRDNPATGRRWKSVYTPDVLAVGEGPASWSDYFTQQNRWARGTNEVMLRSFHRFAPHLGWGRRLHYALLMSYYPSAALSWVLGSFNVAIYLVTGTGGVVVAANLWLMLYVNAAVLQVAIYFWNRRYNVSPHEEEGSSGALGMLVSVLSAPMYVVALVDAARGRDVPFAVTPKGSDSAGDQWAVFRKNLTWGVLLLVCFAVSLVLGHDSAAMRTWALLAITTSFLPVVIWQLGLLRERLRRPDAAPAPIPVQRRAAAGSSPAGSRATATASSTLEPTS